MNHDEGIGCLDGILRLTALLCAMVLIGALASSSRRTHRTSRFRRKPPSLASR